MAEYTDQEKDTIRRGAFGAMGLVSKADPGFFASFSESFAGAKALSAAPPEIAELLQGGLIAPTASTMQEFESQTLQRLSESMRITAKDPAAQSALRDVILAACQHVADASKGTSAAEQGMIDKVRQAVGGGAQAVGGGAQAVPQPGQFQANPAAGMGAVPAAGAVTDAVGSGAERVQEAAQQDDSEAQQFAGEAQEAAQNVGEQAHEQVDEAAAQAQDQVQQAQGQVQQPQDQAQQPQDQAQQAQDQAQQAQGDAQRAVGQAEDFAADQQRPPAPGSGGGSW